MKPHMIESYVTVFESFVFTVRMWITKISGFRQQTFRMDGGNTIINFAFFIQIIQEALVIFKSLNDLTNKIMLLF